MSPQMEQRILIKNKLWKKHDDISIAHMSMIQGVVTPLETNSFTLKAFGNGADFNP
jgi:hypothetical protein